MYNHVKWGGTCSRKKLVLVCLLGADLRLVGALDDLTLLQCLFLINFYNLVIFLVNVMNVHA